MAKGGAAAEFRRIEQQLKGLPRRLVEQAVKDVYRETTKQLKKDTGGDQSLSGAPRRLSVTKKVDGTQVVIGRVAPARRGLRQWTWLQSGARPRTRGDKTWKGTKGKKTWTKAAVPEVRKAQRMFREEFKEAIHGN